MGRFRLWLRAHPLVVAFVSLVVGMGGLVVPPLLAGALGEGLHEAAVAAVMAAVIVLVGGSGALRPSASGLRFSLRASLYLLVIVSLPLLLTIALLASASEQLGLESSPTAWLAALASAVPLSLGVALFEEALFRGIITSAFVERFGRTRLGVAGAAAIASVVFGFMHVAPAFLSPQSLSASDVGLSLARTAIMSVVGLLLAALYLRTHNLWPGVLVHAINDLLLFVPMFVIVASVLGGGNAGIVDVLGGSGGGGLGAVTGLQSVGDTAADAGAAADPGIVADIANVLVWVGLGIVVAVYVPVAVTAWRQLRRVDVGEGTIFSATWEPGVVDDAGNNASAPPAVTLWNDDGGAHDGTAGIATGFDGDVASSGRASLGHDEADEDGNASPPVPPAPPS